MDFYQIKERSPKPGTIEVYPDFVVSRSKDLMVRGGGFYAIWDEEKQIWSTDEYDVPRLVDAELFEYKKQLAAKTEASVIRVKTLKDFSNKGWSEFKNYMSHVSDCSHQLDTDLTFLNTEVKKKDYRSKRLSYPLEEGPTEAYDEIMGTLYEPEEREKLEWAIGAIVAGDAKDIQKFIVLYGAAGTGKSTFLNIVEKLFDGYFTTFEAKALTGNNIGFATEVFRNNPLVAIQHDGDLSTIADNTKLNSIVSHEMMTMNEKYKPAYSARVNCFAFMGTNKPVKITDAKSGIIRRLIDVHPSGNKVPTRRYHSLVARIDFELGAIAFKCLSIYRRLGKNYYSAYRPMDMILQTDVFFNFIEQNYFTFKEQGGVSLSQAYEMYKVYCDEALVEFKLPRHKFREELKNYFDDFSEITRIDGKQVRSYYSNLKASKFTSGEAPKPEPQENWLSLDSEVSLLDDILAECPAQYAGAGELPKKKWVNTTTKLSDLDTTKLHYIAVPENHIVIDFDLKDADGKKSPEKNLEAASTWPPTYAEFSKSQAGLHLHYIYEGDTDKLANLFSEGIEVKVFRGDSSLRRKLSKCNAIPVAKINSGLPLKEVKVVNLDVIRSEKTLRDLIMRNLRKEIHPATKPSIDFIKTLLDEAYKSGMVYDLSDLEGKVMVFANNSTHQSAYCMDVFMEMKFKSEDAPREIQQYKTDIITFFDVEVFPNLFLVCWKYEGPENKPVYMINPTPQDIEPMFKMKLVGFNNRRYDNHILYGRYLGYNNEEIYALSQSIVSNSRSALFREAYDISYTDVYDFTSKKQSLKRYQIDLGIHHQELGLPWDQPVPEEMIPAVAEYCGNDVISLEATFNDRKADFVARQILAELSGLTVNDTTQAHTAQIVFGSDQHPQSKFIYTDLSEMFPGYTYDHGKSSYRGKDP